MRSKKDESEIMAENTVYKKMSRVLPAMLVLLLFVIVLAVATGAVYVPLDRSFKIILAGM
ncbi:MAG: hypothetical protein GX279_06145, partial [Clostridiaceae bacterium]|nr:hypothetical protein [Clostridiaceae bacterium]